MAAGQVAPAGGDHGACRLAGAVGRTQACPGLPCPFWDEAEDLGGACIVEQLALERTLELQRRHDLADWLLRLRGTLVVEGGGGVAALSNAGAAVPAELGAASASHSAPVTSPGARIS
jgi:hypothetical protein